MKLKRVLAGIVIVIALLGVGGYLLVRSWSETPYGRLDSRVAVYLKLTGADRRPTREIPIPVSRKRLEERASFASGTPVAMASVKDMTAQDGGLSVPVRVYWPEQGETLPVVVFYHGGGWVQGSRNSHDPLCRILAKKSGAIVVSVDYRLAPENPFPAAADDAYAALRWVSEKGRELKADTDRIAVAGDSAGGNLAAVVCLMARDKKGPAVAFQALIYPGVNSASLDTESYRNFAEGFMLRKADVERFIRLYLPNVKDRSNPYASPLLAKSHANLPPALVITAGFDPLRDEGEAYAKRLRDAGVPARAVRYPGMIHAFVSADRLIPQAGKATDEIAAALRGAFSSKR
ncbi:MAG: alpha/beta hydrolase [Spirochaetes bacterium]|nr:alpha/beta hydrolase [Spirochaetota bacterium]